MAFWSSQTLKAKLPTLITPYDPDKIEQASYTLRIGREIFITKDHRNSNSQHTKKILSIDEAFVIPPGQFAFLLTEESVKIPDNAIAFISMKARLKYKGLVNISGFHVDPGFSGKLLYSVYNAGPTPINLQHNLPIFLIWYASLDETDLQPRTSQGFSDIPIDVINQVSADEIYSLQALSSEFRELNFNISQKITQLEHNTCEQLDKINRTNNEARRWVDWTKYGVTTIISLLFVFLLYISSSVISVGKFIFEQKEDLKYVIEYAKHFDDYKDTSISLEKQKKDLELLSEKQSSIEAELNTLKKNHPRLFNRNRD
ncbi:MAG: hypothetical protein HOP34_02425 [Methylococcaceae bacterium]|nr:hypothetical protein [Methylococcaceae bacterium]